MPLPPTPPRRPLGPPVLFAFRDVSIRTRTDAIEASGSWDGFLDDMADVFVDEAPLGLHDLIERLVPPSERHAVRYDFARRVRSRQDSNLEVLKQALDYGLMSKPSLLDRLFGKAA